MSIAALPTALLADALDAIGTRGGALHHTIRGLTPTTRLAGRARTVRVVATSEVGPSPYERQMDVVDALEPGDVLVVAVDDDLPVATWGELFSCAAMGRGVTGVVTDGLVRDTSAIIELGFPVYALGSTPLDTLGRADMADLDEPVRCGGVEVRSGDTVVADLDGVIVVPADVVDDVAAIALTKAAKESGARSDLLAGLSIRAVWDRYGVV
jgi:regulator of RNase E activity RraA